MSDRSGPTSDDEDALRFVLALFTRRDERGAYVYSAETVLDFIPAMLLSFGFELAACPPDVRRVMERFAARAGLEGASGKDEIEARIQAYFAAHPLDARLVFEYHRGLREELIGRGYEDVAEAFAKYLPSGEAKLVEAPTKEPPKGAVRGGPLAQFLAPSELEPRDGPAEGARKRRAGKPRSRRR